MTPTALLPHTQYLDLLDRHGRAGVEALGRLLPEERVGPLKEEALTYAQEHLGTLAVWEWLLRHPESDWRAYEGQTPPVVLEDVLAEISRVRDELTRLLVDVGPDVELDYFGRPGTSHEVARLLAHEAINVALAASEVSSLEPPALHPDVAADCVDRALAHWAEPGADVLWQPAPAHLVASDTDSSWWVRFGTDREGVLGDIALGSPGRPVLTVTDSAAGLLRWLHDYPGSGAVVEGEAAAERAFKVALGHRVEPEPRRRSWWRRAQ
ncbi:hypothetical protein [Nocardioides campestrisoli]|uniref:hypothetical protein n=1 Tax=Nocardioides campestrisoli TaxID=2736757 RepID=UPI0015E7BA31|nr:hypothetical protein [Nocardioides campestrisoli]